jgi:hypothetical protein
MISVWDGWSLCRGTQYLPLDINCYLSDTSVKETDPGVNEVTNHASEVVTLFGLV